MLDIILIQDASTGINLLEYRQVDTQFKAEHSDIFSAFLSAIQSISEEIDIGTLVLISTEGTKGHNCIIVPKSPINVIMLVDQEDPIALWKEQGHEIANKFIETYGTEYNPSDIAQFGSFETILKEMCATHQYCE